MVVENQDNDMIVFTSQVKMHLVFSHSSGEMKMRKAPFSKDVNLHLLMEIPVELLFQWELSVWSSYIFILEIESPRWLVWFICSALLY